ncbi:MAG: translocation/assembly module TamB domain-containing protein, partial [Lentisphaerota bacterium]
KQFQQDLLVEGAWRESFSVQARSSFRESKGMDWQWHSVTGFYGATPFVLAQPAGLTYQPGQRLAISNLMFRVGEGMALLSGESTPLTQNVVCTGRDIPLEGLTGMYVPGLSGELSWDALLSGNATNPFLSAHGSVYRMVYESMPLTATQAVDGRFEWDVSYAAHAWKAKVNSSNMPGLRLAGRAQAACPVFLWPPRVVMPHVPNYDASLAAALNLERIPLPGGHFSRELKGQAFASWKAARSADQHVFAGWIGITNGIYQDFLLRMSMTNIDFLARVDTQSFHLIRGTARDSAGGTYSVSGAVTDISLPHFQVTLDALAKKVQPVALRDARGLFDGQLSLKGNENHLLLSGGLKVQRFDFTIPDRLPSAVVDLQVVEINKPPELSTRPPVASSAIFSNWAGRLSLNIDIDAPRQLNIKGRGINSEWAGRVRIGGTALRPVLEGGLHIARGTMTFMGRRMDLAGSSIQFDGSYPVVPLLSLRAEGQSGSVTVRVTIEGPSDNPAWRIDSTPPLPEDEAIARLLFDRTSDRLSPMEALRIASGLSALRGGGNGIDMMGRMSEALPIDQFDISNYSGDQKRQAVSVGKYVSQRVYVEVEKTLSGPEGDLLLEINFFRNLTLQTYTGNAGNGNRDGLYVNWSYDY